MEGEGDGVLSSFCSVTSRLKKYVRPMMSITLITSKATDESNKILEIQNRQSYSYTETIFCRPPENRKVQAQKTKRIHSFTYHQFIQYKTQYI